MKTGIITHYNVHNHGAVLQLYALEKVIEKQGHEVAALQFTKNMDFLEENSSVKYNISLKSIPFYLRYMKEKGIRRTWFNVIKKKLLDGFKKNNNMIGVYYSRTRELDAVFIGADEIFSIEPGLNPVFWGMGIPCDNVFSYAASFGPTTLEFIKKMNAQEFVNAGCMHLKKISVRDGNSREIIESVSGIKPILNCDPVILYDFESEKTKFERKYSAKYILIYAYDNNMNDTQEVAEIKRFAKKHNFDILSVGFYHKWCDKNINVDPLQLMEYVYNAEFVITDTFHGTVISLVMNTPFATKVRGNTNKLGYLLEEYDSLDNRIESFGEIEDVYIKGTNFIKINNIIETKRDEGLAYVNSCFEEISK